MSKNFFKEGYVVIELMGQLRSIIGKDYIELEIDSQTGLREVLRMAREKYPGLRDAIDEAGRPLPTYLVFVNGVDTELIGGLNSKVGPGDKITLVPISHGG